MWNIKVHRRLKGALMSVLVVGVWNDFFTETNNFWRAELLEVQYTIRAYRSTRKSEPERGAGILLENLDFNAFKTTGWKKRALKWFLTKSQNFLSQKACVISSLNFSSLTENKKSSTMQEKCVYFADGPWTKLRGGGAGGGLKPKLYSTSVCFPYIPHVIAAFLVDVVLNHDLPTGHFIVSFQIKDGPNLVSWVGT